MADLRVQRSERKSAIELLKVWGPLLALVAIGFAFAISRLEPPPQRELKIAAGPPGGAYHAYAARYQDILARDGFTLEVVATAGSPENLELLRDGSVALALLQGGIRSGSDREQTPQGGIEIESLASLFFEPVWVFHRADQPLQLLSELTGRRIAIGSLGSGTHPLASQMLADNGIDDTTAELLPIGSEEAAGALEAGSIDAAIFVSSTSASFIDRLVARDDIDLLSIRRSLAYRKAHPFLSRVVLGEGVLDIDRNLPAEDISLVAAAASLVATSDLHHALVPLLLTAMREVHAGTGQLESAVDFPAAGYVDHSIRPEAERYLTEGPSFLHRYLSYRAATAIDRLKILLLPLITLLIPVFKTAPPIYRWRIRSKIYRWYEDLRLADDILLGQPSRAEIDTYLEVLRDIEDEVVRVDVPLSYMDEYYSLRVHIHLIVSKLEAVRRDTAESDEA